MRLRNRHGPQSDKIRCLEEALVCTIRQDLDTTLLAKEKFGVERYQHWAHSKRVHVSVEH